MKAEVGQDLNMTDSDSKFQTIIEGAYKIFTEHGIRNVSMDDICRMLGISKKTLYQFVENKVDLVKKIGLYIRETIKNRMEELEKLDLNAIDVLLEMSKIAGTRHLRINPVIAFELRKFYPQAYEEYISSKRDLIIENVKKNIDQGIKEGLYRLDLNKDIVAHLYF